MTIEDRMIGEARVEQADRRCRSGISPGQRHARRRGEKRSFDRRTQKRFSEAGVSTAAIRRMQRRAAGIREKILRHYTRGPLPFSLESARLPLVLTFFRLRLAAFADR
ncbi:MULTISPECIES: hypothetical protein [Caballeronia]|uniref:hypothetical protein n=1 Tax=Caballeronia TaxID=1827195 RepID=UPI001186E799|nr:MULTISPECIES: hypothetical protein [Caballeronia]MCG7399511.1 hypothetical protein [Caballeronia zhejiangensis]MCI1041966.1 hypothetical protein [Caballeronia zhejiangensis]MDR5763992.1 hypothetical protein [Caballeronia sp. LZ028]MDR5791901.1 hypothetical protein [Caballeronia sp. LZ008]